MVVDVYSTSVNVQSSSIIYVVSTAGSDTLWHFKLMHSIEVQSCMVSLELITVNDWQQPPALLMPMVPRREVSMILLEVVERTNGAARII